MLALGHDRGQALGALSVASSDKQPARSQNCTYAPRGYRRYARPIPGSRVLSPVPMTAAQLGHGDREHHKVPRFPGAMRPFFSRALRNNMHET